MTPPPPALPHRGRLPPGFAAVADLLGGDALLRLVEAHGGTRLYVPEKVRDGDALAALLGPDAARRLVAAYGRDTLRIPLCKPWAAAVLHDAGHSYPAIARRLRMSENSLGRMLGRTEAAGRARAGRREGAQLGFRFGD